MSRLLLYCAVRCVRLLVVALLLPAVVAAAMSAAMAGGASLCWDGVLVVWAPVLLGRLAGITHDLWFALVDDNQSWAAPESGGWERRRVVQHTLLVGLEGLQVPDLVVLVELQRGQRVEGILTSCS